ncbi:MAG: GvpL/GvpF family gas vesicle protein [Actinopolymorphaceae bacterium]
MSDPVPTRLLRGRPPPEIESLVADADRRARSLVCEELAQRFAEDYRATVARWLDTPHSGGPVDPAAGRARRSPAKGTTPEPSPPPSPSPSLPGETAWYLYAIVRSDDLARTVDVADLVGVEDRQVELVTMDNLAAVTAEVPVGGFRASGDDPDLSADGWLHKAVRAHEHVLERLCAQVTALPLRFGALYPSRDQVRAVLRARAEHLHAELDRVDGAAEWGVRARAPEPVPGREEPPSAEDASDGTQWMLRRRQASQKREHARQLRATVAAEIDNDLSSHARETVIRACSRQGDPAAVAFDAVYLVPRSTESRFHEAVDAVASRHADEGLRLEVTGPWPPYHFVQIPTEDVGPLDRSGAAIPASREPGNAAPRTRSRQEVAP